MKIPLPTIAVLSLAIAFSTLFCLSMENQNIVAATINSIGFTICLSDLVNRLVNHFKVGRKA